MPLHPFLQLLAESAVSQVGSVCGGAGGLLAAPEAGLRDKVLVQHVDPPVALLLVPEEGARVSD